MRYNDLKFVEYIVFYFYVFVGGLPTQKANVLAAKLHGGHAASPFLKGENVSHHHSIS